MGSKTFIILKPDALERGLVDAVIQRFLRAGFTIKHMHYRVIDKVLIRVHYKEVIEREGPGFVTWLDQEFVHKPAISLILSHEQSDGIALARKLLGHRRPDQAVKGTIRGDYGVTPKSDDLPAMNLVHASDSEESYNKEKNLWFRAPNL